MRTRKLLAGATILTLGLGAASQANAQLLLKGSDTLEDVAKDAVVAAGLSAVITYVGGGSGGGQAAMTATPPTQQIAPMSRQLNGTACTTLGAAIGQELIGLDGIAVVGANQTGGDSDGQSASTADDCNDNITGGVVLNVPGCTANDGCDASSNYTFADWKDVLAMVYGGQNHNTAQTQLVSGARNPARINCNSPVRRALVDTWGNLFSAGHRRCQLPHGRLHQAAPRVPPRRSVGNDRHFRGPRRPRHGAAVHDGVHAVPDVPPPAGRGRDGQPVLQRG